jgi:hypothetical protein
MVLEGFYGVFRRGPAARATDRGVARPPEIDAEVVTMLEAGESRET